MISRVFLIKTAACLLLIATVSPVFGQSLNIPRQERLLNGAKLLMWPDASANRAYVKVRIHSGTSFDPQGKEGVMSLLAESFFPNEASREFFKDDLGGSLDVTANYDFIQINAAAKPDEFLTMLESVAAAVSNPSTDKETTAKLKARRLELLTNMQSDAAYVADQRVSKQLFGTFPYGRPSLGTTESVTKIDFPDLIDARQRFLTSDNATISIGGKFDPAYAYRAARRLFGSWMKSDKLIPSTFKQPDVPDTKMVMVSLLNDGAPQVRFALRGVARNDKDYAPSRIFAEILEARAKENAGSADSSAIFVENKAHILPGSFVVGFAGVENASIPSNLVTLLLAKPVTATEFDVAKAKTLADRKLHNPDEYWLDADTFKLASAAEEQKAFETATLADVQRVVERLSKNPIVAVTVTKAEKAATTN